MWVVSWNKFLCTTAHKCTQKLIMLNECMASELSIVWLPANMSPIETRLKTKQKPLLIHPIDKISVLIRSYTTTIIGFVLRWIFHVVICINIIFSIYVMVNGIAKIQKHHFIIITIHRAKFMWEITALFIMRLTRHIYVLFFEIYFDSLEICVPFTYYWTISQCSIERFTR